MTQTFCPKCKKPISEKDTRCPHCNMKIKAICPNCGSANSFGVEKCLECNAILIKYCENCGSANYPDAQDCRKCHFPFEQQVLKFEKKRTKKEEQQNNSPFFKKAVENTVLLKKEEKNIETTKQKNTVNFEIPVETKKEQEEIIIPEKKEETFAEKTEIKSEKEENTTPSSFEYQTLKVENINLDNIHLDEVKTDSLISSAKDIEILNSKETTFEENVEIENNQTVDEYENEEEDIFTNQNVYNAEKNEQDNNIITQNEDFETVENEEEFAENQTVEEDYNQDDYHEEDFEQNNDITSQNEDFESVEDEYQEDFTSENEEEFAENQTVKEDYNQDDYHEEDFEQNNDITSQNEDFETVEDEYQEDFTSENEEEFTENQAVEEESISVEELIENSENTVGKNINLPEEQEIVFFDDAQQLMEQLSNIIRTQNNAVISGIAAEEGMGKTTILRTFIDSLSGMNVIPFVAECSESIKLAPFGCIRDFLLKLLTLPDMHPDIETFYGNDTRELFVQNFPNFNSKEIMNFMNFLYPTMHGHFETILENKNETFTLLEKIIIAIMSNNKAIFVIDNFDYIDTASFEFIQHLIKKNVINNNTKLFITYREKKSARNYFDEEIANQDIFTTMYLNNLQQPAVIELIKNFANTQQVPTAVNYAIFEKGNGNIFFTEQFLALLFDVGYMYIDKEQMVFKEDEPIPFLPKNIDEVIQLRLKALGNTPELKDSLLTAAIIGYKFDKSAFAAITDISEEQANQLLQQLVDLMYIQQYSEFEYSFKNISTWAIVFEEAHKDPRFNVICKKVFYIFGKYALANPILKASVAKYRDEEDSATNAWLEVAGLSSYLGDTYIYALSMEQYLIHSGYNEESTEITTEQQTAMENIAKLVSKQNPQKAIKYLTTPISLYQEEGNSLKVIELGSYMVKACYETSDYNGVVETIDLMVNSAQDEITPLNKSILLSRKLNALFKEGNCEEGINLANNDILPVLEDELSKDNDADFSQLIFSAWFEASINLSKLYSLQGNSKSLEIIENVEEILKMNNIDNVVYNIKMSIAKAFAFTVIGRIQESVAILKSLEEIPEYAVSEFINDRNVIYSLNLVLSDVTTNLREILFEYAKYAENTNNQYCKHVYKLMLAWLLHKEGEFAKANVIFNEELTFFAKEKTVTGALIGWLFIAKNTLETVGVENAEHVAMKALEVAQNPKFSQYHVTIYIQKLIAEINLLKGDLNSAKMYLEKGMLIAKQFGLELARIELYRSYAKYLEYSIKNLPKDTKADLVEKIQKLFETIIEDAEKIKVPGLPDAIKNDYQTFIQSVQ